MMIVTSPRSSWTAFITSIDLDFTILLAPVVAWKPVFKSIFFQVASYYSRCKVHSKIILPSPEWPRTKNKNINTSVGASDYRTLSAQSANLERFASNSFCPLKFSFAPKDHFRNCNAQNISPVQLDWQHYWAPAPGGEAEKAGWSSPPFPRSPTRLRRQLLPEVPTVKLSWRLLDGRSYYLSLINLSLSSLLILCVRLSSCCRLLHHWLLWASSLSHPECWMTLKQNLIRYQGHCSGRVKLKRHGILIWHDKSSTKQIFQRMRQHLLQLLLGADVRGVPTSLQRTNQTLYKDEPYLEDFNMFLFCVFKTNTFKCTNMYEWWYKNDVNWTFLRQLVARGCSLA